MASITKRFNHWQARITWRENGKRKSKSKGGFKTKAEAQKWADKMAVKKDQKRITTKDPTFVQYFHDWSQTYREPGKTITSKNRYGQIENHLKAYFGAERLSQVTHLQYQQFINEYGAHKAKSTMQKNHGTIKACVSDAVLDNIIPSNFAARINLIWDKNLTKKRDYLSMAEAQKLENNLMQGLKPGMVARYMIITALYTGMRIGEILALKWTDINYSAKTFSITKSYDYIDHRIKEPKTKSSIRTIKVNQKLLDLVDQLKANHQQFVFATKKGKLLSDNGVNKVLWDHLKDIGIDRPTLHFHSLRHTHASILLYHGMSLQYVSKRLGHSNMLVTARVYSHIINELKAQQDNRVENLLDHFNEKENKLRVL